MYKAVIFDLDGTILDTIEDLADSMNYALAANNLPARTLDEVKSFVGNGIMNLVRRACGEEEITETVNSVYDVFCTYYSEHCADKTKPYEGIPQLLAELKAAGVKTAVVSNKADVRVKPLAEKYYPGLFDIAVGERTGIPRKPAPDAVLDVVRTLGVALNEAVYIGDSEVDVKTAINARMPLIAVSWGFRDKKVLLDAGAVSIADSVDILREKLFE